MYKRVFYLILVLVFYISDGLANETDYYKFNAKFGSPLVKYINYPECEYTNNICRRWGIAAEIPVKHRSKSSIDERYIRILNSGGINFIRFNSIDSKRNKIFDLWVNKKIKKANNFLKLMDSQIPLLRSLDIQYSLSANDFSLKSEKSGAFKNGHPVKHKQYKGSQLTHLATISTTREWLKWIYSRKIKDKNYTYGKDPGNRYITLVGEDSIYFNFLDNNGRFIDRDTFHKLEGCITGKENSVFYSLPNQSYLKKNPDKAGKVANCLNTLEKNYYNKLLTPEFKKLLPYNVATSNSWYGLGYLFNNNKFGTFVDAHSYFDHIIYNNWNHSRIEMVRNRSIISEPGLNKHGQANLLRSNLISLFSSAIAGKQLYVSEWNQPFWSDYAYEGPLLMLAYASFQDYPLLTLHTLMSWNDDKEKPFSKHGFSVHGNQVLQALNPTLALAYRREDIKPSNKQVKLNIRGTSATLVDEMFKVGLDPSRLSMHPELGLVKGMRITFDDTINSSFKNIEWKDSSLKTDTKQIKWKYGGKSIFIIDSPRFKAITGSLKEGGHATNFDVRADNHGSILMISLDGEDIEKSSSILFTTVSSQKSYGMKIDWLRKKGFTYPLKAIIDPGHDYVLLRKLIAKVTLSNMIGKNYKIFSIDETGDQTYLENIVNDVNSLSFTVGGKNTPWYRLVRID